MPPKKITLTPQLKSDIRRAIGEDGGLNDRATDKVLLSLCRKFRGKSEETQSTMALGIYEKDGERVILVALQQGAAANEEVLAWLGATTKYADYKVPRVVVKAAGLHAEMIVVRVLMLTGVLRPDDINGSAAAINLRIACPEKNVCPDCAGYLHKHKIPHYPVDCGFASPNWVNPRTGACFRATADGVSFYYKFNPDPKKPDTVWGDPVNASIGNLKPLPRVVMKGT